MNLSLQTGPMEPGQLLSVINTLIQLLNAAAPGILNSQVGSVGNAADTTDDTTFQFVFPAAGPLAWPTLFPTVGQGIRVRAWGVSAATANNKTFKIFFGATTVISSGVVAINAKSWYAEANILRSGVSTQKLHGSAVSDATLIAQSVQDGAEVETAAITLKVTNASPTTGAAGDLLTKAMTVEMLK